MARYVPLQGPFEDSGNKFYNNQKHFNIVFKLIKNMWDEPTQKKSISCSGNN